MKKLIVGLMLGAILLVNTAFANTGKKANVNDRVEAAFRQEFVQAKEVSWQKSENFFKAVFKMNDDILTAYFTEEGEFIGVTRNLLSTELPISLQTSLKKDYNAYWVTELFEYAKDYSSTYYITIENADQKVTLQSVNGGNWTTYLKVKK
jgi:hypothetical protein